MRIGIFYGAAGRYLAGDALVSDVASARASGFASYWLPHLPVQADALTSLAIAGREVPDIELGTAVVPMWSRHPLALAQQALTTNELVGGRLSLGVGLAHQRLVEPVWGIPFERPVQYAREYLRILAPALRNEPVDSVGERVTARWSMPLYPGVPAPRLYVAALGEKMLELAGTVADGTILWMTGPNTIATHTAPTIRAAAERAGRPQPRVIAGVPVLCTDDVEAGRALAAKVFERYGSAPSYRAMLDREGYADPAEIALIGDEAAIATGLEAFRQAGVDELICSEFGPDDDALARTRQCLAGLL